MNAIANLAGKALLPAALVLVAMKLSGSIHEGAQALSEGAQAVSQASDAVQAAAAAAQKAADIANGIATNAPDTAGKAAHKAGEEGIKGIANGVVQVAATVPMAPVTGAGKLLEKAFPSEKDRDHIDRVINPKRWKIF